MSAARTIYLSARFPRRDELAGYRQELTARGHEVTSRWLDAPDEHGQTDWAAEAAKDLQDIRGAMLFIAFTERSATPGSLWRGVQRDEELMEVCAPGASRGGRHQELGYAVARQQFWGPSREIIVVGPREGVLTYLPWVRQFDNWAAARDWIGVAS